MKTAQFTHAHKASQNQQCLPPTLAHHPIRKLHVEKCTDVRYQGIRNKMLSYRVLLELLISRGSLHCSWFAQWGYKLLLCLPRTEANTWPHPWQLSGVDPVRLGKSLSLNLVLTNPVRQSFWQNILILLIHFLFQLHIWKTVLFYIASYKVSFKLMFWSWSQRPQTKSHKIKIGT